MKNKIKYTNEPIEAKVITDFLPKSEELVLNEEKTKVTLELTKKSVDFFRQVAKEHKGSYEDLIRGLLDFYVANQRSN